MPMSRTSSGPTIPTLIPTISAMSERERADLPPTHMPARPIADGGAPSRVAAPAGDAACA